MHREFPGRWIVFHASAEIPGIRIPQLEVRPAISHAHPRELEAEARHLCRLQRQHRLSKVLRIQLPNGKPCGDLTKLTPDFIAQLYRISLNAHYYKIGTHSRNGLHVDASAPPEKASLRARVAFSRGL